MRFLQVPLRRFRAQGGLWWFRQKELNRHHFITPREGSGAFAVFGSLERLSFFTRHYLDEVPADNLKISSTWNPLRLATRTRRLARELGLVVFTGEAAPRSLDEELLTLDLFVPLIIPLSGSLENDARQLGSLAKANLRKIRARGYRSEISTDADWAQEFYERYHRPSIQGRHGDDGFVSLPGRIIHLFKTGNFEWLRVFDGETCIAACIGERKPDAYHLHRTGWLDGSPALQAAGASAALYWFGIRRAIGLGLPAFNLGGVMPDLENGLFVHKAAWGGRLDASAHVYVNRRLLLDPAHPHAHRFLSAHSLLIRDKARRFFVISPRLPAEVPACAQQAPGISAWFRLRDTPDPLLAAPNHLLPIPLRPWYDAIPLVPPAAA